MGWFSKGFLVLLSLLFLATGLWFLSLPIFGYLLYSLRPGKRKVERTLVVAGRGDEGEYAGTDRGRMKASRLEWHWRYAVGGLFLIAALVAISERGTFAPFVFGGLGLLCIFWTPLSSSRLAPTALSPVRESIILTSKLIPLVWTAIVEVKLTSHEAARALAVLRDNLIVTSPDSERPGVFLAPQVLAPSYRSAETKIARRLQKLAPLFASRGAYLLPLDSLEAAEKFQERLEPVKLEMDDSIVATIGHSHYDVLVIKPGGSLARSVGAYSRVTHGLGGDEFEALVDGSKPQETTVIENGRTSLPQPRQRFQREPVLWEVISSIQERIQFPEPDGYTMLLNSMHVSKNLPLAQKLSLASRGSADGKSNGATVVVESLGGAPVELTRAQLRAVVRIYG